MEYTGLFIVSLTHLLLFSLWTSPFYRLWYGWFPEANQAALANKALPLRTRVLQWMAGKRQWWAVKLYYRFVYQFVYGIIYR